MPPAETPNPAIRTIEPTHAPEGQPSVEPECGCVVAPFVSCHGIIERPRHYRTATASWSGPAFAAPDRPSASSRAARVVRIGCRIAAFLLLPLSAFHPGSGGVIHQILDPPPWFVWPSAARRLGIAGGHDGAGMARGRRIAWQGRAQRFVVARRLVGVRRNALRRAEGDCARRGLGWAGVADLQECSSRMPDV